jgi:hypothetical protein
VIPDVLKNEILGESNDADAAEQTQATAYEVHDEAPELSAALAAILPPDDDSGEDDDTEDVTSTAGNAEPARDYEAELAARDARVQQLEAERLQTKHQLDLQMAREHAEAYRQAEAIAVAQAEQAPDWETAKNHLVGFYRQREQAMTQAFEQGMKSAWSGAYVTDVAQKTGLSEEDVALLRTIPAESVPQVAQALQAKNAKLESRFQTIEQEQQQLKRARQSQRQQMTGVHRPSGQPRVNPPRQTIQPGSVDHTLAILAMNQAVNAKRNGR